MLDTPVTAPAPPEPVATTGETIAPPRKLKFIADLVDGEGVRDKRFLAPRGLWFAGELGVRGKKTGIYLAGRVVLGPRAQQVKGWLRIGAKHYDAAIAGEPVRAYVTLDGTSDAVCIGLMTNLRELPLGE